MTRTDIKRFVEVVFYDAFYIRYENLFSEVGNCRIGYVEYIEETNEICFTISKHKQEKIEVMRLNANFLDNAKIIEECKAEMNDKQLNLFNTLADYIVDHDSYNDKTLYILKSLKDNFNDIYQKVVNDNIIKHLHSRNMQILIETNTSRIELFLTKKGYLK